MILIGALVVGAIAAFVLFNYMKGERDKIYADAKLVPVFQVQSLVKRGTPGNEALATQLIAEREIPQQYKPSSAVNNSDEIVNKVAAFDLAPGTVVVQDMFVDQSQTQITFRQRLKNKDHVAMSFSVDDVRSVAGFLVAGDEVNMIVTQQVEVKEEGGQGGNGCTITPQEAQEGSGLACLTSPARMLYQKVQILAVGSTALLEPGEETVTDDTGSKKSTKTNTGLITINVPPEASLWIASLAGEGNIYLTLVAEEYQPRQVPQVPIINEELPGEKPSVLTPYGPDGNTE